MNAGMPFCSVISSFSTATGWLTRQWTLLQGWVVAKWIPFCITPFPLIVFFLFIFGHFWSLFPQVNPGLYFLVYRNNLFSFL